jgi:hypothetical protein
MPLRVGYRVQQWFGVWLLIQDRYTGPEGDQWNDCQYWHEQQGWMRYPGYASHYLWERGAEAQLAPAQAWDALEALGK